MLLILAVIMAHGVDCFFPSRLTEMDIGEDTFTHQDITEIGILRAVGAYFEDHPGNVSFSPGELLNMEDVTAMKIFQRYYGEGATGTRLQGVIDRIVASNNALYKSMLSTAALHFNGETFKQANSRLIGIREQIITILKDTNPNYDLAADLIGDFLHILQMFYSNTNWVEMFGPTVYTSLGIRDKPLFPQATPRMNTCRSCGPSSAEGVDCKNTLILDGEILTSGYRSGQDEEKPYRNPQQYSTGKCSHGGDRDASGRESAALGGINKDSVNPKLSPHYYLHLDAAKAAIDHTIFFFNDIEYGLRYIIEDSKYRQLLQLKTGISMVFNIDYTGSMSDDITAVKQQVIAIVQDSLASTTDAPSNYIVVLFNDPESLMRTFQSESGEETIAYIQSIRVNGGGDCPEYLMAGLVKSLQLTNPNSRIWTFTDAPAKDPEKFLSALSLASAKNVRLLFILSNGCSRKRREATGPNIELKREKRSTNKEDLYSALAAATAGTVYVTTKGDISQLANVIKETATVSVTVLKQRVTPVTRRNITVNVDNTITQLTVEVAGTSATVVEIYNAAGVIPNTNVTDLGTGKIIKLNNPSSGEWKLEVQDSGPVTVTVTAQSTLDVTSTFVQLDEKSGFEYEIIGRPISGDDATIVIFVPSKTLIQTLDAIQLVDSDGQQIATYSDLKDLTSRADIGLYKVKFPLPEQGFQVAVQGKDTTGIPFTRLQTKTIVPVAVQLVLLPENETLYVSESVTIEFVVINKGDNSSVITVTISNDQGFTQSPADYTFTLSPSQNKTGYFNITAGSNPGVVTTVTITATTDSDTGDSSQFVLTRFFTEERVVRVEDNTPPFCNITSIVGSCDMDPCTCAEHSWTGSADIGDHGFGLYKISSSVKDLEAFSHDDFDPGHMVDNGTVTATVSGDCCNPRVYITAVDMASNTGLCVFDLAPEQETPLTACKPVDEPEVAQVSRRTIIIIAAASGAAALLVVVLIVAIACVVVKNRKSKPTTDKENKDGI